MIASYPTRQIRDFLLFENIAVGNVLMGRVLLHVMRRTYRVVSTIVIGIIGELDPPRIEFRMPVKTHGGVHFHDERIEFVQRHEIANESFEKRDIVAAGKIELDAAKWLVGPVADTDSFDCKAAPAGPHPFPQRFQAVESA